MISDKRAPAVNAKRRAARAVLRILRTADPDSQVFLGACLQHKACPTDPADRFIFVATMKAIRLGTLEYVATCERA